MALGFAAFHSLDLDLFERDREIEGLLSSLNYYHQMFLLFALENDWGLAVSLSLSFAFYLI